MELEGGTGAHARGRRHHLVDGNDDLRIVAQLRHACVQRNSSSPEVTLGGARARRQILAETAHKTRPAQIVIGLLLSIGVAELPLGTWSERLFSPLAGHEVFWGLAVLVLLLYVALIERRPLSSIGFRKFGFWGIVSAIIAGVLMVVAIVVIYTFVFPALHLRINMGEMKKLMDHRSGTACFWSRAQRWRRKLCFADTRSRESKNSPAAASWQELSRGPHSPSRT